MARLAISSGSSAVSGFRLTFEDAGYACKDPRTGSLRPVPLDQTRQAEYCPNCKAEICLLTGKLTPQARQTARAKREAARKLEEQVKRREEKYQRDKATKRARGLSTSNTPLTECCWNCVHLRKVKGGYLCRWDPSAPPAEMPALRRRMAEALGCTRFDLRREVEIPPFSKREGYNLKRELKYRAEGLNSSGQPLTRNCWNCSQLRWITGNTYLCPHTQEAGTRQLMARRQDVEECPHFELRLTLDVPAFEEPVPEGLEGESRWRWKQRANLRRQGINSRRQPLSEVCWNCIHLREVGDDQYVCRFQSRAAKHIRRYTQLRCRYAFDVGCKRFELRRVMTIPRLG